ncbi:hypothetical protein CDL15_Pgr029213 [Punica granatum]|uniref:Uncharacterized protein n=1 Tax=Punica granatum TaxID=22663 RepID=A0A218XEU1_PUNGR|nr:hypothetical protein CDL15_Pgr029213 [Punica granatum]
MTKQRRRKEAVREAELRALWSSGTGELRAVSSSARKFELSARVCAGTSERVGAEGREFGRGKKRVGSELGCPDRGSWGRMGAAGSGDGPQCEASKAPVDHVRAYRDILNDAPAALSIIRRARRLRTLLVRLSSAEEPIEDPVGVDKLVVSHGETLVRTMCGGLG